MQADNIHEDIKNFTSKLVSTDPVNFDYAINEYFEANAVLDTQIVHFQGASKIKKLAQLQSHFGRHGKLVGEPTYDEKNQIIKFAFSRTYTSPALPTWIPFAHHVSQKTITAQWKARAYLNADEAGEGGSGEGRRYYVTRVTKERDYSIPFENFIPWFIIKPVFTIFILGLANVVSFYNTHKKESLGEIAVAALVETVSGIWSFLLAETGKRQAQAEIWRDEKKSQAAQFYSQALSTATSLQADLESRAKAAGIPVDQYKSQIATTLEDFKTKAAELQTDIEGRAKRAGVPVEEYRKQVDQAIAELQKRAQGLGDYFDLKANEAKEAANKTTTDGNEGHVGNGDSFDGVPTTPLGGHDPTAPGAPSFAAAVAQ